jgi:serine protease Do
MVTDLVNLSSQLAETVERAAASIVAVHARRGIGSSGFVWRDSLILTSSEGIRAEEGIKLVLPDGTVATARLRGRDTGTDLAVLETEGAALPPLDFAEDGALRAGQLTIAVGRTSNTGPIASFGIVSGVSGEWKTWRGGKIDPFVRLDISGYPTLSGGAALDASGNLIGLVSTGLSRSSVFAVTRATIDRVAGKLAEQGFVSRGFLGVSVQPVALPRAVKEMFTQDSGLMLVEIEPEGPAAAGRLVLGDVLLVANGPDGVQALSEPEALSDLLARTPAGETLKLQILRAGEVQDVAVRIGERPSRRR